MPQYVYASHCQPCKGAVAAMYIHIQALSYARYYLKLCLCHQANSSKDRKEDCSLDPRFQCLLAVLFASKSSMAVGVLQYCGEVKENY